MINGHCVIADCLVDGDHIVLDHNVVDGHYIITDRLVDRYGLFFALDLVDWDDVITGRRMLGNRFFVFGNRFFVGEDLCEPGRFSFWSSRIFFRLGGCCIRGFCRRLFFGFFKGKTPRRRGRSRRGRKP